MAPNTKQSRRQIAGKGRVTAASLRSDVTDIATVLETIRICAPPPFTLIVVDAASIEAQIAADRRHCAVSRPGDCLGGLRERSILVSDKFVAGEGGDGYACANRYAIVIGA